MFTLNENDLIRKDIQQSGEVISSVSDNESRESEIKVDHTIAKEELKDLEVSFSFEKIEMIKKLLVDIQNNVTRLICLLGGEEDGHNSPQKDFAKIISDISPNLVEASGKKDDLFIEQKGERIIEGVFNGQNMIGADGQEYAVPANYASKSKLVEGDILKLIIDSRGNFIYKQIGPIERTRIIGTLVQDGENFAVTYKGRKWRVLTACVTYFKGKPNDEAVILIPKNTPSRWAAVENIIKKSGE